MLQRIRKSWLTTQATGRYYTPPTPPKPFKNTPKPPRKHPPNKNNIHKWQQSCPSRGAVTKNMPWGVKNKQWMNQYLLADEAYGWKTFLENMIKYWFGFAPVGLKLPPQKRTKPTRNQSKINTKTNPKLTLVAKYHPTWKNWAPKCCKYHGKWEVRTPKCWPLKWWPSGSPLPPLQRTPCLELNVGLPVTGISPKKWMNWWKSTWFSEFLQDCWIIY